MAASLTTPVNPTIMENDAKVVDKFVYLGWQLDEFGVGESRR